MLEGFDVSVVISTYNRSDLLPFALEGVLAQQTDGLRYEVIVVDNNSTDNTREVVSSFAERFPDLRYVFEPRQGLSHGWNAGISRARSPIVALTDDDLLVPSDWVASIKQAFDEHPEVDFIGSRVLPLWKTEPPPWLTPENWSPLALCDYGDNPSYSNFERPLCLLSKSFRREVFDRVGLFAPRLGRVKGGIGSLEDNDLQRRIWKTGGQGLYVPDIKVLTEVQSERLTRSYHRRWHFGHGRFYAVMRAEYMERSARGRLFDVPGHMYRRAIADAISCLKRWLLRDNDGAFKYETRICFFAGFFSRRSRDFFAAGQTAVLNKVIGGLRLVWQRLNPVAISRNRRLERLKRRGVVRH